MLQGLSCRFSVVHLFRGNSLLRIYRVAGLKRLTHILYKGLYLEIERKFIETSAFQSAFSPK